MKKIIYSLVIIGSIIGCTNKMVDPPVTEETEEENGTGSELIEGIDYFLPNIDLNNWKVTLPIGNPTEVKPPEILDYASSELLAPFMYNDSIDGSLVFHCYPGSSTTNSSYSRTELREQMVPGSNNTNWTFGQEGQMKGTLKMEKMDKDADGDYYRTIIMQIHGRLTNTQRDLIGEDDNNAPPVLKIYWNDGRIRVHRKVLKDINVNDIDILKTSAWTDEADWLGSDVNFDKFILEIKASEGRLEVILNENENVIFDDIHMQKWGVFENYFKAGNYFQTKDQGSSCTIKYYDLEVSH
ncbi:MAG: hypothetical protein ACJA1A_001867 [Saprospiraceae bacterium]|jgi:hypothetical protein